MALPGPLAVRALQDGYEVYSHSLTQDQAL